MKVLVVGAGQVGIALAEVLKKNHDVTIWDIEAKNNTGKFDVMHICYCYNKDFVKTTIDYIEQFNPMLTIIESTVKPTTTEQIFRFTKTLICHSPIRGCHDNLMWGIKTYTKFIGPTSTKAGLLARDYYNDLGLKTYVAQSAIETELAKLLNLSYFATCISFFQEAERISDILEIHYADVVAFIESTTKDSNGEVQRPIFKGNFIGGHCVMQGLEMLFENTELWNWISTSNRKVKNDNL